MVAALTTTPKRIHLMKPVFDSLVAQSLMLDAIWLFVPYVYKRDPAQKYTVPSWLREELNSSSSNANLTISDFLEENVDCKIGPDGMAP